MLNQINIRAYENKDKLQILELLNRNFNKQEHMKLNRDIEWWEWKYEKNIFGKPIIYIAEHNGKIIGVRPFWPWKLTIGDKKLNCFQPIDSVVDPEYRGIGIFTILTKTILKENSNLMDLVFNFPNEQSVQGNLKMGWTFVSRLQWYVKINDLFSIGKLMKNFRDFHSCPLQENDRISREKLNQIPINSSNDNKLKSLESFEFYYWRYLEHPKMNYGLNIINKNGKKFFYIFEINENNYGKELIILDYFGDFSLFKEFLKEINVISKKYKITYTLIIKKYEDLPKHLLFKNLYLPHQKKNLVVLPLSKEFQSVSAQYNNWQISLAMHDSV